MKRVLAAIGFVVATLVLVLVWRGASLESKQIATEPVDLIVVDPNAAAQRLGAAIRFETISHEEPGRFDADAFRRLHEFLAQSFPLVHAKLRRETINEHTLLFEWTGRDAKLKPAILMGHIDVVPIVPGTEERWEYPAFSGEVAEGFIWGRGAMDDKFTVLAILEAVEQLLADGVVPARTIFLTFGHDEEIGGPEGAVKVAEILAARGIQAEMVLDEGGAIITGAIPGVGAPVATIGIAEKGSISLSLKVKSEGGHSSTPPEHTAIGILATAIDRLERDQMPGALRGTSLAMLEFVAPEMSLPLRSVFANLWLFGPLVESQIGDNPAGNATLRTTTAVTVIRGGVKSNVLPTDAEAIVNFRTLPGDTGDVVIAHVRAAVADPRVEISVSEGAREATDVSPVDDEAFRTLHRSIREVFPGTVVSPYLTLGGTDSRHFSPVAANIFRFSPLIAVTADLARPHGLNERVGVENYARAIQFYAQLIRNL